MASSTLTRFAQGLVAAALLAAGASSPGPVLAAGPAAPQATLVVAEGNDFATRVLGDPWDMNSLADVSFNLNTSGQFYDNQNISVANGFFSAQSTSSADANFWVLYPGYTDMIKTGNNGALKPIHSGAYHCLYTAMSVQGTSNIAQAFWFADTALNLGTFGSTDHYPPDNSTWLLQKIDLASPPNGASGTGWNGSATWQGLRIDPTHLANRNYAVDWVRLTDCNAVNVTVHWGGNSSIKSVWLRPQGTTRDILVKGSGVVGDAGQTVIDVQGVQPGTYEVWVGTNNSATSTKGTDILVVNQAPIFSFVTPSAISGADYATQAGNPWDFANGSDVESAHNMATSLTNGLFDMVTQSASWTIGGVDGQFFLNSPQDFNGSSYRYLSFRMFTEWTVTWPSLPGGKVPWPNMPDGMVARLIWSVRGPSGPTYRCYYVSQDIPFDIGWHTYTIDLFDSYNGKPEQAAGDCVSTPNWQGVMGIKDVRFDPNENVSTDPEMYPGRPPVFTSGGPFHQQLDWIKLTAPDRVTRGTPYLLQIDLNRPAGDVTSSSFYYTTDKNNPTQHTAARWSPTQAGPPGPYRNYLPSVQKGGQVNSGADTLPQADLGFWWNTANVSPGTYYTCATVTAGPNTATYCSDVPMVVQ